MLLTVSSFLAFIFLQSATLQGKVDDQYGEGVPFATIILWQADKLVAGTTTDEDGKYLLQNLDPGDYVVECRSYLHEAIFDSIQLQEEMTRQLDFLVSTDDMEVEGYLIPERKIPLIETVPLVVQDSVDANGNSYYWHHSPNVLYLIDSVIYQNGKPIQDLKKTERRQ